MGMTEEATIINQKVDMKNQVTYLSFLGGEMLEFINMPRVWQLFAI
jgi:hypothetical protein